jgi:hypothetical protein
MPRRGERGQMLIVFALLIAPVTFAIGVVAVDASVWQSERRGAQKDADLAALAGAQALLPEVQDKPGAEADAIAYGDTNDESGNAASLTAGADPAAADSVVVDSSCFGTPRLDAVRINLNHESRTFFAEAFGISIAPDIGAHARACVGSLTNPRGLRPFAIDFATSPCFVQETDVPPPAPSDLNKPKFGEECTMDFGAQGSPGTSDRGLLDLETSLANCSDGPGSGDLVNMITNGANGTCFTNQTSTCNQTLNNTYVDCVRPQTGNVANNVLFGIQNILANEGDCDAEYSVPGDIAGIDDFQEALELLGGGTAPPDPDNIYTPRPCNVDGDTSPRLITIVAVPEFLGSNDPMPIRYFVPMYIVGCNDVDGNLDRLCTGAGPNGHIQLRGIIFQAYLVESGDVGAPNDSGTKVITLDE